MKLAIGCDDAAIEFKNRIKEYLENSRKIEFEDVGTFALDDNIYYPKIAERVVKIIQDNHNEIQYGMLFCGTGIGMALSANKFKGIRAAVCHDIYSAERAKKSNNANILTMGARIIAPILAQKLVDIWLDSEYTGGRSTPKVQIIDEFEEKNFK
jgi:ribose 5-phosphate isomerase B